MKTDHWTKQRKNWLDNISPFHRDEGKARYIFAWLMALVFNTKMPHEKR